MSKSSNIQQILSNKGDAIDDRAAQVADEANDADEANEPDESVDVQATREERIRIAAYAAAERRGFEPGYEVEDWLEAERQTDGAPEAGAAPGTGL